MQKYSLYKRVGTGVWERFTSVTLSLPEALKIWGRRVWGQKAHDRGLQIRPVGDDDVPRGGEMSPSEVNYTYRYDDVA